MSIAEEPDLPQFKAVIAPFLELRSVPTESPEGRVQIPSVKEDLFGVVCVDGETQYELLDRVGRDAFRKRLRTLEGAIREAELYLALRLAGVWQGHLAKQFGREALSDLDYPLEKDGGSGVDG